MKCELLTPFTPPGDKCSSTAKPLRQVLQLLRYASPGTANPSKRCVPAVSRGERSCSRRQAAGVLISGQGETPGLHPPSATFPPGCLGRYFSPWPWCFPVVKWGKNPTNQTLRSWVVRNEPVDRICLACPGSASPALRASWDALAAHPGSETSRRSSPPSSTSFSFLSERNFMHCAVGNLMLCLASRETPSALVMRPWEIKGCVSSGRSKELAFVAPASPAHPAALCVRD